MDLDLDVVRNKVATIERCIRRIDEEYQSQPENLKNYTKQDAIILNVQRACEAAIDLAMHLCSKNKLGIPQDSRGGFELLAENLIITNELAKTLKGMVGFRNVAVHDYKSLNLAILQVIIEKHLDELLEFGEVLLKSQLDKPVITFPASINHWQ